MTSLQNTVELHWLELQGTVKMWSSYRKIEPQRSRNFREKKSDSDPLKFPVYKIDREQSEKNVSKERLKIPKRYSIIQKP
jgi:hypothetical protein